MLKEVEQLSPSPKARITHHLLHEVHQRFHRESFSHEDKNPLGKTVVDFFAIVDDTAIFDFDKTRLRGVVSDCYSLVDEAKKFIFSSIVTQGIHNRSVLAIFDGNKVLLAKEDKSNVTVARDHIRHVGHD